MAEKRNRRRFGRQEVDTTILFRPAESQGEYLSGQMRNISDGGVAFDTADPPAEGDVIDLFFKRHANAADQRVRGQVVWARAVGVGSFAIGVSFLS